MAVSKVPDWDMAADDGLPTAEVTVDGHGQQIKLDSGTRYSVAASVWMARGERTKRGNPGRGSSGGDRRRSRDVCPHPKLWHSATVTKSQHGRALVPAINMRGGRTKLPSKRELTTWIRLEADMEVLALSRELDPDKLDAWLDELGDTKTPLGDEEAVNIGAAKPNTRVKVLKLLRPYPEN
ncbi:unnamed protein product [Phytophthora fragariaefolia]|uniref:Unnamed protein product n=1 Tax=Phytophthora fragariaefolia TaxID=1490495 RepID=A0A9W6U6C9_9STRA|nr:unnamed protein product [Phytophthora fragariaefolia]